MGGLRCALGVARLKYLWVKNKEPEDLCGRAKGKLQIKATREVHTGLETWKDL